MRPVMQFVTIAMQARSSIQVRKAGQTVDGKNPLEMALLDAPQGTEIELQVEGDDAAELLESLVQLIERGFDEV